jgi:hypothetical protein
MIVYRQQTLSWITAVSKYVGCQGKHSETAKIHDPVAEIVHSFSDIHLH